VRPNLRSAARAERRLNRNVIPIIGNIRLADLHPRDINAVIDPILKRKRPREANMTFEALRAMLRWAVKRGDLDHSPIDRMAKPAPEGAPRERVLSDNEIRLMWNALAAALRSKAAQRIVKLCLITGQRVGEIAGMRIDELDFNRAVWSLPGDRVKNGTAHTVPLSEMAIGIINEAIEAAGKKPEFVFPSIDARGNVQALYAHAITTAIRRAHMPTKQKPAGRLNMAPFTAHDLRRTALTRLAALGVQPIVIGAIANHLSVTKASVTFMHYVQHSYQAEARAALDLWAERLDAIITGPTATVVSLARART
ncbi:MAG: site-specific integrase, partial [Alphaproteobacteria bacterium]